MDDDEAVTRQCSEAEAAKATSYEVASKLLKLL